MSKTTKRNAIAPRPSAKRLAKIKRLTKELTDQKEASVVLATSELDLRRALSLAEREAITRDVGPFTAKTILIYRHLQRAAWLADDWNEMTEVSPVGGLADGVLEKRARNAIAEARNQTGEVLLRLIGYGENPQHMKEVRPDLRHIQRMIRVIG